MRNARLSSIALPIFALAAAAVSAIVFAAHAGLAFCGARVAIPLTGGMADAMPGMDMPDAAPSALMICPVALALIGTSVLFALAAIVLFWRDPHRRLTGRALVRALAGLPIGRAAVVLTAAGGTAVALMFALDGSGAPAFPVCALLALMLAGCSVLAAVLSILAGHVALALGQRLLLAIVAAISALCGNVAPKMQRRVTTLAVARGAAVLAAGRGLRAPPLSAR
jgi:hypothetical protein